jgi:hypothetical protein
LKLTILVASSAVVGLPNALPHAQAATNANLFVSAENSQWNNYFAGPQVIQVVVADPDINRLDQAYGEPVVTVNGKRLRMAQATDGNWYAYFADRNQAIAAGNTAELSGKGLNFGGFCNSQTSSAFSPKGGVTYTDTKGFTIAYGGFNSINHTNNGGAITSGNLPACISANNGTSNGLMEHVIRENKTLNSNPSGFAAGAVYEAAWPIVQLYDFSAIPTAVTVDYQKNGGDQIVNLTFDRIPQSLITTTADRSAYSQNSQVFLQVNDPQLNVDPTEDDSWTWGTNANNNTVYYQAFTRNGAADADGTPGMQNLIGNLTTLMFNHNGALTYQSAAQGIRVTDFQADGKIIYQGTQRGDPAVVKTLSIGSGSQPLTLVEQGGVNTGVFGNWDGSKKSEIVTVDSPLIRGQSSVVRYNQVSSSIVGGFAFATLTQAAQNNTWASGQKIPVTLTDNDDNKNSKISERMFLYDPTYKRSTAMVIGTPFTLSTGTSGTGTEAAALENAHLTSTTPGQVALTIGTGMNATASNLQEDELYSARPIFNFTNGTTTTQKASINSTTALFIDLKASMNTLLSTISNTNRTNNQVGFKGFNFLNYDLRSFSTLNGATGGSISNVGVYLVYNNAGTGISSGGLALKTGLNAISIANSTNLQDFINLNGTNTVNALTNQITTGVGTSAVANPALLNENLFGQVAKTANIGLLFTFTTSNGNVELNTNGLPMVTDFFSVGLIGDGTQNTQRINNGIFRYELEETGDNTGVFTGTNEYLMLNQLNIFDPNTYTILQTIQNQVYFPAIQDMLQSEARAPQITYLDLGSDGVNTAVSAQQDIPTHTGVISFDSKTYKIGDTVTVTLNDEDLNVNNDLIDIYTAVTPVKNPSGSIEQIAQDNATDTVGKAGLGQLSDGTAFGRLVDVQFGQANIRWSNSIIKSTQTTENTASCFTNSTGAFVDSNTGTAAGFATSLSATGFSLVETGPSTGIFTGTFEVPDQLCQNGVVVSAVGQNIKVNYVDFRDDSGKLVEVSDNSGIKGNTGSVKLDKSVYPVPFGQIFAPGTTGGDFPTPISSVTNEPGVFPMHRDLTGSGLTATNTLSNGDVIIHIRVNDQDFNISPMGTDKIALGANDATHGPVAVQITRAGNSVLLGTAGGPTPQPGFILNLNGTSLPATQTGLTPAIAAQQGIVDNWAHARDFGPMTEISPDAGIFQADIPIRYTDGPQGTDCPTAETRWTPTDGTTGTLEKDRFYSTHTALNNGQGFYCVRQGDVLTVQYTDLNDASGNVQTVTDSSTFDLRNGVLQSDKSVL